VEQARAPDRRQLEDRIAARRAGAENGDRDDDGYDR